MNYTQAYSIIAVTKSSGGGTFQRGREITKELQIEGGYVIGGLAEPLVLEHGTPEEVTQLIKFGQDHSIIGTWFHNDQIIVDAVEVVADRDEAIQIGKERGEKAIWDIKNEEEIFLDN